MSQVSRHCGYRNLPSWRAAAGQTHSCAEFKLFIVSSRAQGRYGCGLWVEHHLLEGAGGPDTKQQMLSGGNALRARVMEIHVYVCVNIKSVLCIHIHMCMHVYAHRYACMHACMHTCIHTYVHTYMHTYIRNYMGTGA